MADRDQTGPWVLALGALAVGAGAAAKLLWNRRDDGDDGRRREDSDDVRRPDPGHRL